LVPEPEEEPVHYSLRGPEPKTNPEVVRLSMGERPDDASPIELLVERFPVIHRLVGDQSFRAVAHRFIRSEPPSVPIPESYGESFPRFLRDQGNAASIEYVADIAELEMARGKARCAADARPLAGEVLSSLAGRQLLGRRILLHPSAHLVCSRFPIVTIWESNQSDGESGMIRRWTAEAALVARPFFEVEVRRLPPGGYGFLRALSEGQTIAMAQQSAIVASSGFRLAANLELLMEAKVIVGIRDAA
jgi:hypothetical protein